jgi:hypothetical protein
MRLKVARIIKFYLVKYLLNDCNLSKNINPAIHILPGCLKKFRTGSKRNSETGKRGNGEREKGEG